MNFACLHNRANNGTISMYCASADLYKIAVNKSLWLFILNFYQILLQWTRHLFQLINIPFYSLSLYFFGLLILIGFDSIRFVKCANFRCIVRHSLRVRILWRRTESWTSIAINASRFSTAIVNNKYKWISKKINFSLKIVIINYNKNNWRMVKQTNKKQIDFIIRKT